MSRRARMDRRTWSRSGLPPAPSAAQIHAVRPRHSQGQHGSSSPRSTTGSKLPEHFGHNWDALADVLEDREWLGKSGRVIALQAAPATAGEHPTDWATLEDILAEAREYWRERHVAFWVFTA